LLFIYQHGMQIQSPHHTRAAARATSWDLPHSGVQASPYLHYSITGSVFPSGAQGTPLSTDKHHDHGDLTAMIRGHPFILQSYYMYG